MDALFNTGLVYMRKKDHTEAEKYLLMAYEVAPESLDVVHELKMAYYYNYGANSKKFKDMEAKEKALK